MTRRAVRRLCLGAAYLLLLVVSRVVRSRHPVVYPLDDDETVATVRAVAGERLLTRHVRIAYLDLPRDSVSQRPAVVLLHGSPGDNGEVRGLSQALAGPLRVIAPDLPGFGASSRSIPDYSFRGHARYVLELLDSLHLSAVHLVGFSMGGGVALSLADIAPTRVRSITMLSAIGAQEFELLGDYHLNHAIHGIQLVGLWLIREAVPHFGYFDGAMLSVEYARNFYDSDQRPLRGILRRYQGPMLIIQGKRDPLVPPAIAAEHRRLVPQSELLMLDQDHFMAFLHPHELAPPIASLVQRAEAGTAITRARADPIRIAQAALPFDPRSLPPATGIAGAILLLLLAAATLVSEDLACIATGLLVGRGTLGFVPGTTACLVGIFLGDLGLYFVGRIFGRSAIRHRPLRWLVSEGDLVRSSRWFGRRGPLLILASRFVPGTRLPTYLAAGILHTRFFAFAGAFLLAALLWTPLLVGVSALFGGKVLAAFVAYRRFAISAVLLLALGLVVLLQLVLPLCSWRGRRLLLSHWRRLTRWEFWPPWAFYPPVVLYVLWLAIRHRSLTLFTAVNPAIPGGGFVGESKADILAGLRHAPDRVARTLRLDPTQPVAVRLAELERFRQHEGLSWPIVLKPDVGERGSGVAFAQCPEEARAYLEAAGGATLAQEHVPGIELGIFYYRRPGEPTGRIFAITEKRFPAVIGDGKSPLDTLILQDDRAVSMARFFLTRHARRLMDVPPTGEIVPLVELGTHCRGAAFYDGEWIRTPELEAAIDQLSRGYAGFWFGRYDVRSPSMEALRSGQEFKVIELNGATSEATSIYDPKNGLRAAYRLLRRQWAILFEIADRNRRDGARPASLGELLALVRRHRQELRAHVNA